MDSLVDLVAQDFEDLDTVEEADSIVEDVESKWLDLAEGATEILMSPDRETDEFSFYLRSFDPINHVLELSIETRHLLRLSDCEFDLSSTIQF
jgi:hypothetical protein